MNERTVTVFAGEGPWWQNSSRKIIDSYHGDWDSVTEEWTFGHDQEYDIHSMWLGADIGKFLAQERYRIKTSCPQDKGVIGMVNQAARTFGSPPTFENLFETHGYIFLPGSIETLTNLVLAIKTEDERNPRRLNKTPDNFVRPIIVLDPKHASRDYPNRDFLRFLFTQQEPYFAQLSFVPDSIYCLEDECFARTLRDPVRSTISLSEIGADYLRKILQGDPKPGLFSVGELLRIKRDHF